MARLDAKLLHAYLNLTWRVIVHYVRKLNPFHEPYGIDRFRKNYVPEGLPPAAPDYRAIAHEPGRCTSCGECDAACPILLDGRPHPLGAPAPFVGPMGLVISAARAAQHLEDAEADLRVLSSDVCVECRACDRICPERIPISQLAEALLGQLAVIEEFRR